MSDREIDIEQAYVAGLYDRVDAQREVAAARLTTARGADGGGEAMAVWQAELARLDASEQGLCFGRLDMHDGRRVYIGRLGLFPDAGGEPLLLDWRAPAARAFYTATARAPQGVRQRRRITTRGRTVVALNDELLDPDSAGNGGLVGEAALLAAVTAARTGRMHDIVTTLQSEQDSIVRHESNGVLVVQGGPGTGKTAVALHRVAYLLYTRAHLRTRGVLVIGPSQIFLDYIGQVLPGLGENSVVTATIADLLPGIEVSRVDPAGIGPGGDRAVFGHVVVDEAQELSEMAWRMLMRRCPTRSMTIVGDLAQTGSPAGAASWDDVLRPHVRDRWQLARLTVNYRTPAEIMAATTDLLAAHHPGTTPPRSVRSTGDAPWRIGTTGAELSKVIAERVAMHTEGQLAIIAPNVHVGPLVTALSLATPPNLTDTVVLLTPDQAKGLEFDAVLIVDPAAILAAAPLGHNDLYVAMTRATHRLGIVHPGPPPAELSAIPELKP